MYWRPPATRQAAMSENETTTVDTTGDY